MITPYVSNLFFVIIYIYHKWNKVKKTAPSTRQTGCKLYHITHRFLILHRYHNYDNYDINLLYIGYGGDMAIYYDSSNWNITNFAKSIPIVILKCCIRHFTGPVSKANDYPPNIIQFMTVQWLKYWVQGRQKRPGYPSAVQFVSNPSP